MPVAQPSPPREERITIYVKPYIRKYLLARLAQPERRLADPTARLLFDELQHRLNGRKLLEVVNDFDPESDRPSQRVVLKVEVKHWHKPDLDVTSHDELVGWLTKSFLQEMYSWVDWYRQRLGMGIRQALTTFRRHYTITDSDHDFLSAERVYHKHCQATGQSRKRRKKKPRKVIRS